MQVFKSLGNVINKTCSMLETVVEGTDEFAKGYKGLGQMTNDAVQSYRKEFIIDNAKAEAEAMAALEEAGGDKEEVEKLLTEVN